ncbi:hypothetical protein GPECTOR_32g442 [Gonium pectorale]|uniref:Uncharacterized protein n=1 Tax=Gonium pectorale TaxID=33097 RepID=A0A150GEQ8_GONPE|nr:hypothetical protein GPECTOR_32g442 [Gonium pectorale]|eukprot:KXZ47830.1 hypothetical protein GPECTOR_32g442 [Gonium pectorale]
MSASCLHGGGSVGTGQLRRRRPSSRQRLVPGCWLAATAVATVGLLMVCGGGGGGRLLAEAKTLERDVFALLAVYQEVRDRDPQWRGAMDKWPVHTCRPDGGCGVDPCGFDWEGDGWEGVSCRYQQYVK